MKKTPLLNWVCIGTLLLVSMNADANLIANGSFENYSICPTTVTGVNNIDGWSQATAATPDYFNVCAPSGVTRSVDVPTNFAGSQSPYDGDAYTGLSVYDSFFSYREYIESELTQPLIAGQEYSLTFYVSLAENSLWASDSIGAYFSSGSVSDPNLVTNFLFTPQVQSTAGIFITDTVSWTEIRGSFIASGGEDHIILGNFKDNVSTGLIEIGGDFPTEPSDASYLYIDSISLVPSVIPIPATVWLFASGLFGLLAVARHKQR